MIETQSVRSGGWQRTVGDGIRGKILGILGLGNIGSQVARIAGAFGTDVIAWSENVQREKAQEHGARLVSKQELFRQADILTIHLILSSRTRGLVGKSELDLMKSSARIVNTSRGPIVDEVALIDALRNGQIAGAAIDVFDTVVTTPHIGYVSRDLYRVFYQDTVTNIVQWLQRSQL
jgi:phosphoglycerate dehydrogenase-like enzyme